MLQLRQFDLQLAFVALRALGKNIQDQAGTVDHAAFQLLFRLRCCAGESS